MRKKSDLPVKTCVACGRPMVWRKRWAKVWAEVKYCSDRCRGLRGNADLKPVPHRRRSVMQKSGGRFFAKSRDQTNG